MKNNENLTSVTLKNALSALIIPIIGYGYAYVYEYAYFKHFRIPFDLIDISFSNMVFSILIAILLVLMFHAVALLSQLKKKIKTIPKIGRPFDLIIPFFLIAFYFLFFYSFLKHSVELIIVLILVFFLIIAFCYEKESLFHDYFLKKNIVGASLFLLLISFPILFFVTYFFSGFQKEFVIMKASSEKIVIRIYKDISITAPFTRGSGMINPFYSIMKTSEMPFPIYKENLGYMKISRETSQSKSELGQNFIESTQNKSLKNN